MHGSPELGVETVEIVWDWRRSGPGKEIVWDWERKLGLLGTSEWVNFFGEKKRRGEER